VPEQKPIAVAEKMKPASAYTKPAWVNRIDFLGNETGKSTVMIGTTHPVNYDLVEVTDKLLRIKLFNTKIPKYRRRLLQACCEKHLNSCHRTARKGSLHS
jgi:type IV pilus assembly protein PilQ